MVVKNWSSLRGLIVYTRRDDKKKVKLYHIVEQIASSLFLKSKIKLYLKSCTIEWNEIALNFTYTNIYNTLDTQILISNG